MNSIKTSQAPPPAGHYSQGVIHNGLVYTSGMLAVDPETGIKRLGDIEEQTALVLSNIDAVLKASGSDRSRVIKCTCYISDIELWGEVNKVYSSFFGDHKPARSIVPTRDLHFGFKIEIDCIAAVMDEKS